MATFLLWEAERYCWDKLRASRSAVGVPEAIKNLAGAATEEEAHKWCLRIDTVVINPDALFEAVVPTVSCVVVALPFATPIGRVKMLEFLSQVANGYWCQEELEHIPAEWPERCRHELLRGAYFILGLLPRATQDELEWCVDILTYLAQWDPELRPTVLWHFEKLLQTNQGVLHSFIEKWLNILKGFPEGPVVLMEGEMVTEGRIADLEFGKIEIIGGKKIVDSNQECARLTLNTGQVFSLSCQSGLEIQTWEAGQKVKVTQARGMIKIEKA